MYTLKEGLVVCRVCASYMMSERRNAVLIAYKVVYLLVVFGALTISESNLGGNSCIERHFLNFDARYYISIAAQGYKAGAFACAFYPLYPLIIRYVSAIGLGDPVVAAMVLANAFSLAGWFICFSNVRARLGGKAANLTMMLMLTFPGSLFFQFIYTESLFLVLLMLLWFGLENNRYWLASSAAFLLPMTRAVGILCVFPIVWELVFGSPRHSCPELKKRPSLAGLVNRFTVPREGTESVLRFPNLRCEGAFCLTLAPLVGWTTYLLLMYIWTGNAFEGFEAQRWFGHVESIHHLFQPIRFVALLFTPTSWHGFTGSILDRCVFILLLYCFPLIWKLDKSWCIWAFFLGVVPAVSGGFTSYTRFASVVFPMFIALAVFLSKPERRWFCWLTVIVFATLHVVLAWRFVNFRWAG
jgi:hypothetical protein